MSQEGLGGLLAALGGHCLLPEGSPRQGWGATPIHQLRAFLRGGSHCFLVLVTHQWDPRGCRASDTPLSSEELTTAAPQGFFGEGEQLQEKNDPAS